MMPALIPVILLMLTAGKFISPDHSFEWMIPPGFAAQTGYQKRSTSYIPICDGDSVVCITYPSGRYKGTTFEGASVEVTSEPVESSEACVNPAENERSQSADSGPYLHHLPLIKLIDGTRFLHTVGDGAAMSHHVKIRRYRGFKHGNCYELSVKIVSDQFTVYDPGAIKEFTKQDERRVASQMIRIVESFRTLR